MVGLAASAAAMTALAAPAGAANFTVNTTADHAAGACDPVGMGGDCTLREAMTVSAGNAGDDEITFSVTGTIQLLSASGGELPVPEANHLLQIQGPGAGSLEIRGQGFAGAFPILNVINAGSSVEISGLTISNGGSPVGPGGIFASTNLTLDGVVVRDHQTSSSSGAGISSQGAALTIRNSAIRGNSVIGAGPGGGILLAGGSASIENSTISGNSGGAGGGIQTSAAPLEIENSTITDNVAGDGGGISNKGALIVTNSTIADNRAEGGGGGIDNYDTGGPATVTLNAVSIVGNISHVDGSPGPPDGGGILQRDEGNFELYNTLVTGNDIGHGAPDPPTPEDCDVDNAASLFILTSLITAPGDCNSAGAIIAPGLVGPLAFNGGPTATVGLLPGSPAHDAGSPAPFGPAPPACPPTDQRGFARGGAEGGCDIGAFEGTLPSPPPQLTQPPNTPAAAGPTGRRAAALRKCKRKKGKARKKCKKRAKKLPV